MGRALTKAERLREMERLYYQRAYTDVEMAARFGVARTTIYRDRIELEANLPFVEDAPGHWRLDRAGYLSNVRLNMAEALTLYLAARRTSQQTRIAHTHVASALDKLAGTLMQPLTTRLVHSAEKILAQQHDPARTAIFETVAKGWIEGRQLRLAYHAIQQEEPLIHHFSPYLLEPTPWSDGFYLIGHSDVVNHLLTLKLERITQADLLDQDSFAPPADFDEARLLRHAWGIWGSEGAPETVRLKFASGTAVRRLRERIWHPLEQVISLPDGGCVWEAPIADWREMLPWVRGWGAEVEVLAPPGLRLEVVRDSQRLAEIYGWQTRRRPATLKPNHDESFGGFLGDE